MKNNRCPVVLKLVEPFEDAVRFARSFPALKSGYSKRVRMVNISILLPTRGRALMLKRLIKSIADTAADPGSLEVVLYLDDDDKAAHETDCQALRIVRVVRPHGRSMGEIFRECYFESAGRYVMLMNDDAVFTTPGWDSAVVNALEEFSDGVALVYGDDLDQGERLPTFPILSRRCCEAMGGVVPPGYHNLHIESHIFDVFKRLRSLGHDRVRYLENVRFEHLHYSDPETRSGESYLKNRKDMVEDGRLFLELEGERAHTARKLATCIEKGRYTVLKKDPGEPVRALERRLCAPLLSVILPVIRDSMELTRRTLDALLREKGLNPRLEIILVSSAPAALLPAYALDGHERLKVIHTGKKTKEAEAFNIGANEAAGEYLLFINERLVPRPGLPGTLVLTAETLPDTGVVGCKQINASNGRIHHAGVCVYNDAGRLKRTHIYRGVPADSPQVEYSREFDFVSGACMLVRRTAFSTAGGFDERLEAMFDMDLCFKVRGLGKKVIYAPEAQAVFYADSAAGKGFQLTDDLSVAGLRWAKDARCDLEESLAEDGFRLRRSGSAPFRYEISRVRHERAPGVRESESLEA